VPNKKKLIPTPPPPPPSNLQPNLENADISPKPKVTKIIHPNPKIHIHLHLQMKYIKHNNSDPRSQSKILRKPRLPPRTHALPNSRRRRQPLLKGTILQTLNIRTLRMSTRDPGVPSLIPIAITITSPIHRIIITPRNSLQEGPAQSIPLLPFLIPILQRLRIRLPAPRLSHVKIMTVITRRAIMRRDRI
jgi:hypothetical protein